MKPVDPRFVPKLARKLAKWQREKAAYQWALTAVHGTKYISPPGVPPTVCNTSAFEVDVRTREALRRPDTETVESHRRVAEYYAETLESAKCFHLDEKLTNLALRTVMPKYKLTLDTLRIGPGGSIVPWGFIVWSLPISQAEKTNMAPVMMDFRSGEMVDADRQLKKFSPFDDADLPVMAASWRYEPDADIVWVAFYTQKQDQLPILQQFGLAPQEAAKAVKEMEPLTLEREQALPLGRSLNWCDSDPREGPRLEMTAFGDAEGYPEAAKAQAELINEAARSLVSDMVRTLIASWMIMKWKVAEREVIPPTQDVIREVSKKTGRAKSDVAAHDGTTVVRLGGPIHKRASRPGGKDYTWKVRALVGPIVRDRQYIPAWGTYDDEPRFIEPYWAGPPDAPISNIDRVFTIDDGDN